MSSLNSRLETDTSQIIERMRLVRRSGKDHAIDLQGEAKRLVDWKEYVKAKPILSVACASLLGFGLVRNLMLAASKPSPSSSTKQSTRSDPSPFKTTLSSSVANLASTIVTNAVKTYVASLMQNGPAKGNSHDQFQHESSKD
jgi:hypothetical protein